MKKYSHLAVYTIWICFCACFLLGCTPMFEAARTGDVSGVKKLLSEGAYVNEVDPGMGLTPLQTAACYGRVEVARELIKHGANVNIATQDDMRYTPLMMAVLNANSREHTEVARILLEHQANINAVEGEKGFTALMQAVVYDKPQIAKILISHNADLNIKDKRGKTVIDLAKEKGNFAFFSYFDDPRKNLSYTGKRNKDIIIAAILKDAQKIKELISKGADVNAKDNEKKTILMYVAGGGTPELLELLIEKGADVNAKDNDGWTAQMFAAQANKLDIVKALDDAGVKKLYSGDLRNDLPVAVLFNEADNVKTLLEKGADINCRYRNGNTPLILAVFKNDLPLVKLLLSKNANPELKNDFEYSPLLLSCYHGYIDITKALLDKGVDLNSKNGSQFTPLMLAVNEGHSEIAGALINHRAEVNIVFNDKTTLLMFAINKGHPEIAKLLLPKVSDINAKNNLGQTALMFAIEKGYLPLAQILLTKNAMVDYDTVKLAEKKGYSDLVNSLKPEAIKRHMAGAEAAVENASSNSDYNAAIKEYEKAKELGGDKYPQIYYNLGFVCEKAGNYPEAVKNLNKYLELSPKAEDAETVRNLIYKIEYKRDKGI